MLINPTLHTLVERAKVVATTLLDGGTLFSRAQLDSMRLEYDNIAAAMRVIKHPDLPTYPATYPENRGTLWAWWCYVTKLHESHSALTLLSSANGRCRGEAPTDGSEQWSDELTRSELDSKLGISSPQRLTERNIAS